MAQQARTDASHDPASYLYRGRTWKQAIKPLAVRIISALWVRWYKFKYRKKVRFGRNFVTNGHLVVRGPGRVLFGDDINAWCHAEKNVFITYSPDALITIGHRTRLSGSGIQALRRISIGPDCMVGSTIMFDTDFHQVHPVLRHDPTAPVPCEPINIERNVWIAGQTAILKGVAIGENSVVAYRAVVAKDVPPNVVVAGNPAKIVKRLDESD